MDFIINTHDNVYVPAEDSYLLADNLQINEGQSVLEIVHLPSSRGRSSPDRCPAQGGHHGEPYMKAKLKPFNLNCSVILPL